VGTRSAALRRVPAERAKCPRRVPRPPPERQGLLTKPDLLGADLTEQARGADDQDDDEDSEQDGVLQGRVEIVAGQRLRHADDKAADIGAQDAAKAAEDHDREGGQDEGRADLRGECVDGREEASGEAGQRRPDAKGHEVDPIHVDAHQERGLPVLGDGPDSLAEHGRVEKQPEPDRDRRRGHAAR
jgi:hypothetical protein